MATKKEKQVALLKVLAAAAWADGQLDVEEVNHIKTRALQYGLDPVEIGDVHALLDAPVSYTRCEELTRELLGMMVLPADRQEILDEVELLLKADGQFAAEEKEVMESLEGIMKAMTSVDGFMSRITGVFRTVFSGSRPAGSSAGVLTENLKNQVMQRVSDLSQGAWRESVDADTLNRYTLFGAVLGRVAELDGGTSAEELKTIRMVLLQKFDIKAPLIDWVMQAVEESASSGPDRQGLLSEYNRISEMPDRKRLLEASFAVAAATGGVSPEEATELRMISNFLWIDPRDFNEIRARCSGS